MIHDTPERLLEALLAVFPRGVGRDSASEHVWEELAARGYDFQDGASPALRSARWFHPGRFAMVRSGSLGKPLHVWGVVSSTNDLAFETAESDAVPGTLWVADEQTAGRGRQGRTWLAPRHSALLFSLRLAADLHPDRQPQLLPLALGVAVCEGLEERAGGESLQVKWPNDITWKGCKLAGMLLESRQVPRRVILGVGVNVQLGTATLRSRGLPAAAGLCDLPTMRQAIEVRGFREELLAILLRAVERRVEDWAHGRFAAILDAWRRRDALRGRSVRLETAGRILDGDVQGITDAGLLEVRDAAGVRHTLSSAEVHLL